MKVTSTLDHYVQAHRDCKHQLAGAGLNWLSSTRQDALDQFYQLGFPTTRDEDWKYTRVSAIEKRQFAPSHVASTSQDLSDLSQFLIPGLECSLLAFVDGVYMPALSSIAPLPNDVSIEPLSRALERAPEVIEDHLGRHLPAYSSGFSALNTAFVNEGAYIHLGANARLNQPVLLLFVSTTNDQELISHPRVLIVAEPGSDATVIEKYASQGDSNVYFNNVVTEVSIGENANIHHYKIQDESRKAFHIATLEVRQAKAAQFVSHCVSLGGQLVRNDINTDLDEHSVCELNGLYVANGRQHMDFHTRVDHRAPHTTSKEFYKGILDGRARGVFNGRVYVHPDAQKTDAQQSNKNLLLSRDAEIDTKPQLEIYADDVKCAHGATVGQLDDNMVFYLRSRGIDEAAARGLLTYGFASEVIDAMALNAVKESLHEQLIAWLPNAQRVKELVR